MNLLSPQVYDAAERLALETAPNHAVAQTVSATFAHLGYPTRIDTLKAASRYVDVMHEGRFHRGVDVLLGGMTDEELALACEVNRKVGGLTERLYGERRSASGSLIWAFNMLRHIEAIYGRKVRVFELGPGSGYLGALLTMRGHSYISTDSAQAFYIWQNHLWSELGPLNEQVIEKPAESQNIHLPWWRWFNLFREDAPQVDVVTANHVLCEMQPFALTYLIRMTTEMLRKSELPLFLFEGWGYPTTPISKVQKRFLTHGYFVMWKDVRLMAYSSKAVPLFEKIGKTRFAGTHKSGEATGALAKAAGVEGLRTPDEELLWFIGEV